MATPFILYDNIYESGPVTATSEESGFDVENIVDWRTYIRWRSTSSATQYVYIDSGVAVTVDSLGIAGHNLGTAGATVSVESSTTGAWSGEEVERLAGFSPSTDDVITKTILSVSVRYWRVKMTGQSVAVEIGVLCLGARLDFPKNPTRPLTFVDESTEATSRRSKNGHILGAVTYYRPYTVMLSFSWLLISFIQGDLYTFWATHGSLLKPFFLQVNIDQWDTGRFVQLPDNYSFKEVFDDYTFTTNLTMTFEGIL